MNKKMDFKGIKLNHNDYSNFSYDFFESDIEAIDAEMSRLKKAGWKCDCNDYGIDCSDNDECLLYAAMNEVLNDAVNEFKSMFSSYYATAKENETGE